MPKKLKIQKNQTCPVCNKKEAEYNYYEVMDPYQGPILIFSIKCFSCGYKNSEINILQQKRPKIYSVDIETEKDLNIRVVKSRDSELIIPELDLSVESGVYSEGFVSNIEYILRGFLEQIKLLLRTSEDKKDIEILRKKESALNEVLEGKKRVKVILKDYSGYSSIISNKVKIEELNK